MFAILIWKKKEVFRSFHCTKEALAAACSLFGYDDILLCGSSQAQLWPLGGQPFSSLSWDVWSMSELLLLYSWIFRGVCKTLLRGLDCVLKVICSSEGQPPDQSEVSLVGVCIRLYLLCSIHLSLNSAHPVPNSATACCCSQHSQNSPWC